MKLNRKTIALGAGLLLFSWLFWEVLPFMFGIVVVPVYFAFFTAHKKVEKAKYTVLAFILLFLISIPWVSAFDDVNDTKKENITSDKVIENTTETQSSDIAFDLVDEGQNIQGDQGIISRVIDGDTVDVNINGSIERIRIIGLNTPETVDPRKSVECFGSEASERAKQLLPVGTSVTLEADSSQDNRDRYDRLLRFVWVNDQDFGLQMISDGYAYEYTYNVPYKYQSEYKDAQQQAELNKLGLWADNACVATPAPTIKPTTAPAINTGYQCNGPDLDCGDFATHAEAQAFFDGCGFTATNDPMRLDGRGNAVDDGIACESLP